MKKAKFQSFLSNKAIKFVARMNLSWRVIGFAITSLILVACTTDADDSFDAASVCPTEGTNAYGMPNRGTFIDERDGQEYRYTTIGDQVWMAQNLNYNFSEAICYDSLPENCEMYGRLYWGMEIESLCPAGWRLATTNDIEMLLKKIDKKQEVLMAGYWYNTDSTEINECGLYIYSAGENHFGESMYMRMWVSFWLANLQETPLNRSYFHIDASQIYIDASYPESRKYIRCIKE